MWPFFFCRGVYGHTLGDLPWAEGDLCLDEQMAKMVGAQQQEISVMNGLTVNLHLLMVCATANDQAVYQ